MPLLSHLPSAIRRRRGAVTVLLASLVIAAMLVGCGDDDTGTTTTAAASTTAAPTTTEAPPPEVTIGVLTPLSQPGYTEGGQLFIRGAELAMEWINDRIEPGVWADGCALPGPVKLSIFDDEGTPEKGVAGLRKLALDDDAAAVVGQIHSSVMIALGPFAEEFQVPAMAGTASSTDITRARLNYVFQAHAITSDRAEAVARFIEGSNGVFARIAVVAENTDYGIGNVDDLKARLAGTAGVEVRDWIFDKESRDLSPLLLQVKSWDPDLIFNVSSGATEYLLVQQADDVGLLDTATMVISDDRPTRQEFWDNVGETGLHTVFVTYFHPNQQLTAAGEWFKAEYTARHGEPPVYTAYQGFGNVIVMAQAINQACSSEGSAMVAALEAGPFTSWNTDNASFPQADGVDWHRIRIPILLLQYTAAPQPYEEASIVFPPELATSDLIMPEG